MSAKTLQDCHPFLTAEARDRYLAYYDGRAASWPVPSEGRTVETTHGRTFVRVSGPADAPPLVLLPGEWYSSHMWIPIVAMLSERFRTYAVDNLYDFGRSVSARPVKKTSEYMSWLDGLFDGLGLADGIALMGRARGAWLAAEYALHAPQRLARVVWLSPGAVVVYPTVRSFAAGYPPTIAAVIHKTRETIAGMQRWLMPTLEVEDPAAFAECVDEMLFGTTCFDMWKVGRYAGLRKLSDTELRGLGVPALLLIGDSDVFGPGARAKARLDAVAPNVECEVFPGIGQDLLPARPADVASRVRAFLEP